MKPRFQINSHVAYYLFMFSVSVGTTLVIAKVFGKSEEEKITYLMNKYPEETKLNNAKREQFQAFFDKMNLKEKDKIFDDILKGGKDSEKKRNS